MRASAAAGLVAVLVVLAAGCGGSSPEAFRIGLLSDCYGPYSVINERVIAAAELPLIERGATLRGRRPSDGLRGVKVAGRPVELLVGCAAGNDEVLPEARRLVEEAGANVVVGPLTAEEGMILRGYARRRPETTFLIQPSPAPELTLSDPAPNVFRFVADAAQSTAGLGAYAYRRLGWRTAATVGDNVPYGWEVVSGFVAEFCALGGRVVRRAWLPPEAKSETLAAAVPPAVDGVFVGAAFSSFAGFVKRYAARQPDLAKHLVGDAVLAVDSAVDRLARGLVTASNLPFAPTPATGAYAAAFKKAFPAIGVAESLNGLVLPYGDGVEAALEALERGGPHPRAFREALARVHLDAAAGPIRLDGRRQAVAPSYLTRVEVDARGRPVFRTERVVSGVEQTFGGYFRPGTAPAGRTSPACRKGKAPPWAS